MGLAGPRKRTKISHDPNNSDWTRSTSKFGHKILSSQGWAPGEYLGPKDSAHAELHTRANAAPIRVSFKDDNLGLGARIGGMALSGQCVGLDAYQGLLGRLNDKGEQELKIEQQVRSALRRNAFLEQRWGSSLAMNFVRAGMLDEDEVSRLAKESRGKEKPRRKSVKDDLAPEVEIPEIPAGDTGGSARKQRNPKSKPSLHEHDELISQSEKDMDSEDRDTIKTSKKQKRADRKRRKEVRKLRKAEKAKYRETSELPQSLAAEEVKQTVVSIAQTVSVQASEPSQDGNARSRHVLRQKQIRQKRLATTDSKSLNEILMIKVTN